MKWTGRRNRTPVAPSWLAVGNRYGRLTVEAVMPLTVQPDGGRLTVALCRCECGRAKTIKASNLKSGNTKSCGCKSVEQLQAIRERSTVHGHAPTGRRSPEYQTWSGMIARCHDTKTPQYPAYGLRGITVCDRWRDSFQAFLNDMGLRPAWAHSIDRIDNDKGYSPENCRWATRRENTNNRRTTNWVTYNGERMPLPIAAERFGVNKYTLWNRIRNGWTHEDALTLPPQANGIVSARVRSK